MAHFVLGVVLLCIGGASVLGRERFAARAHARRGSVDVPMAYLVVGSLSALAGVVQIVLAFRS